MDTPLSSFRVQERPSKRSCIDIDPSPSALPGKKFDQDVAMLLRDQSLPEHLRSVLSVLLEDRKYLNSVLCRNRELVEEVASLKAQNAELRAAISGRSDITLSESRDVSVPVAKSLEPQPLTPQEFERKRSIVVIGLPESSGTLPSDRLVNDINLLKRIFDFLDIECSPVSIYRMGRVNRSFPRLLKVILPSSFFVSQVLRRAPNLRYFSIPKIFIRPSLTREQRNSARTERLARRNSSLPKSDKVQSQNPSDSDQVPPQLINISDTSMHCVSPISSKSPIVSENR
ncbi:hypothetical protein V3C99_005487 [Haemonchus contortus]